MRPTVLLDVDPGHDDLLAMATAQTYAELVLVTTAAGNASVDETTRNARRAAAELGIEAPVVAGDGGGAAAIADHAVAGTWIVAVAPLTNIAGALRLDPGLATRVSGISIMGGDWASGADPSRERNHGFDPPATAVVGSAGARLVRCGLDLTSQVRADDRWIASLPAPLLRSSLQHYAEIHVHRDALGTPLHDPCAVLAVTHPELFTFEDRGAGTAVARTVDAPSVLELVGAAVASCHATIAPRARRRS